MIVGRSTARVVRLHAQPSGTTCVGMKAFLAKSRGPKCVVAIACLWVAASTAACVSGQNIGGGATAGALEEIKKQQAIMKAAGEQLPMEQIAGNSVRGALSAINQPDQQAELGRAVGVATDSAIASALGAPPTTGAWGGGPPSENVSPMRALGDQLSVGFTQGMSRQLRLELGPDGTGPLGQSLSRLAQGMSGAAASSVVAELAPVATGTTDCAGPNRQQCIEQRTFELSRTAAAGFADGMAKSLRFPLLAVAFGAGFLVAWIAFLLMRTLTPASPSAKRP
jgi:hypothetical protein